MKIYLANEVELEPLTVSGEPRIVQGETRDCLSFHFPASAGLDAIHAAFSEENCESIRLVEDSGTEHVHTGYVLRTALTLTPGEEEGGEGRITVTMEALLQSAMNQNFIPVVDDLGTFTGIVTRKDIIRYFAEQKDAAEPLPLRKIV